MSRALAESHAGLEPTPLTMFRDRTAILDEIIDLDSRTSKIVRTLQADPAVKLQPFTVPSNPENINTRKSQKKEMDIGYVLCVNIYGPADLADLVGDFASQCKLFLQDPQHCDRIVEYRNPHRMPFDEVVLTNSLQLLAPDSSTPKIEVRQTQDLFGHFEFDEDLTETEIPPYFLKTTLQPYHVVKAWKTRSDPQALAKLKLLINSITIRRPKREVNLPSRTNEIHKLDLDQEERTYYDNVKNNTIHKIDSVLDGSEPKSCLNALQMITTLRLICNHGIIEKEQRSPDTNNEYPWGIEAAQQAFDGLRDTGQAYCMHCREDLSFIMTDASECGDTFALQPRVSKDFQILCPSCIDLQPQACHTFLSVCNHLPRCPSSLSSGTVTPNMMGEGYDSLNGDHSVSAPSKIRSLISSLSASKEGEKRRVAGVVFSYWTKTLDLIENRLKEFSYPYNRLDGRLSARRRDLALQDFRSQPGNAVLLISITCGAVG
ncbi:MAG: hypothetical protein Q9195_005383 [Heterodermia aff. obscurata]